VERRPIPLFVVWFSVMVYSAATRAAIARIHPSHPLLVWLLLVAGGVACLVLVLRRMTTP